MELEAGHRRHAEIENAIRDLKYGVGLNHLPSGRFAANAAWLAVQVIAHNLARWTARLGLGEGIVTTRTLRRRYFALAGRLTRSARCSTLHLPKRWPWAGQWAAAPYSISTPHVSMRWKARLRVASVDNTWDGIRNDRVWPRPHFPRRHQLHTF